MAQRIDPTVRLSVQSAADYDRVPKGMSYTAPDGHVRVKQ